MMSALFGEGTLYLWVKVLHILFVTSWFAGLFYLPRLFVNLAQEEHPVARERLIGMSRRLYRFMNILVVPAIATGLLIVIKWHIGLGPGNGWFHAKVLLVVILLGYHHGCGSLLKKFERGTNTRSHVWYRWFNEIPVLILLFVLILVVLKPF